MTITLERAAGSGVSRRERRRARRWDEGRAATLVARWYATVRGAGLDLPTSSCAGLPGLASPQIVHVALGDPDRLLVRTLPGQVLADFGDVADRLAEGLGVSRVRVVPRGHGFVWVELLARDPLAAPVLVLETGDHDALALGMTDMGRLLTVRLSQSSHMIIQGATRSGKSRFLYGLLGQLAGRSDVLISGSDLSGILLRALAGTRHHQHLAIGSGKITEHAEVLEALVAAMDDRLARMPRRLDVYPCGPGDPYMVTVIEELPGLLRAAAAQDAIDPPPRGSPKLAARIQAAYGRLLAEGAKVGFRLILVAQRADATIVGGHERGQCPLRISFPVDTVEGVRMLHPGVDDPTALAHVTAPPGRALISGPGLPLTRLRSLEQGDYGTFLDRITAVAGSPVTESTEE